MTVMTAEACRSQAKSPKDLAMAEELGIRKNASTMRKGEMIGRILRERAYEGLGRFRRRVCWQVCVTGTGPKGPSRRWQKKVAWIVGKRPRQWVRFFCALAEANTCLVPMTCYVSPGLIPPTFPCALATRSKERLTAPRDNEPPARAKVGYFALKVTRAPKSNFQNPAARSPPTRSAFDIF